MCEWRLGSARLGCIFSVKFVVALRLRRVVEESRGRVSHLLPFLFLKLTVDIFAIEKTQKTKQVAISYAERTNRTQRMDAKQISDPSDK